VGSTSLLYKSILLRTTTVVIVTNIWWLHRWRGWWSRIGWVWTTLNRI